MIGLNIEMKISAIIFDQDGVLIDSEPIHYLALTKFFGDHDYRYDLSLHERYFGYNAHNFFTNMRENHGVSLEVEYMKSKHREYIHEFEQRIQLMPSVINTLEELTTITPNIALATGTYRELTERNLNRLNLKNYFKGSICGDEVLNGKPHPEIYLKAAELIKAKPSECLVVEDSPAGIESAKKAGMVVVSLLSNHNQKANLSQADHQIKNLDELSPFLRSFR